jgi:hypothetical protein
MAREASYRKIPRERQLRCWPGRRAVLSLGAIAVVSVVWTRDGAEAGLLCAAGVETAGPSRWNGDIQSSRGVRPDGALRKAVAC